MVGWKGLEGTALVLEEWPIWDIQVSETPHKLSIDGTYGIIRIYSHRDLHLGNVLRDVINLIYCS